jgi:hypothetical protein
MKVANWFEKIVGFNEKKWNYQLDSLDKTIVRKMGNFETKKIKDLKTELRNITKSESKKLKVLFRKSKNKENENSFDTSALQFYSPNGTLFQVASNFNCHELGSCQGNIFSGKYLTQLMDDCTQGPSAAGGAVFGALLRVGLHKQKEID